MRSGIKNGGELSRVESKRRNRSSHMYQRRREGQKNNRLRRVEAGEAREREIMDPVTFLTYIRTDTAIDMMSADPT